MEDQARADAEQGANEPLAVAILKFTDHPDGSMSIDATHSGIFDPVYQSHACLRAVSQFLPQICAPVGTRVDGNTGIKLPITDADRYQALRTLALIPEEDRNTILDRIVGEPKNEAEFDTMADKIVELCRGMVGVPGAGAPERQVQLAGVQTELVQ